MLPADSVSLIREAIRKAPAVLDSLVRYEFLKQRTGYLRADVQHCQAERLSLTLSMIKLRAERDSLKQVIIRKDPLRPRLQRARLENWGWRGLATLGIYLQLRSWLR
ncbi:hypothetical protein [Larkinella sp.]|uniref:hypothetical protein n=1 Tax=Larkinella sp. TaxID=2034517 RepID=UPI003BACE078